MKQPLTTSRGTTHILIHALTQPIHFHPRRRMSDLHRNKELADTGVTGRLHRLRRETFNKLNKLGDIESLNVYGL